MCVLMGGLMPKGLLTMSTNVANGQEGYLFQRDHRDPGAHPNGAREGGASDMFRSAANWHGEKVNRGVS
jgi:hypothetical protein